MLSKSSFSIALLLCYLALSFMFAPAQASTRVNGHPAIAAHVAAINVPVQLPVVGDRSARVTVERDLTFPEKTTSTKMLAVQPDGVRLPPSRAVINRKRSFAQTGYHTGKTLHSRLGLPSEPLRC